VADEQRSPALPNVPTLVESRIPGMLAVTWFAVVAPPGTPAAIVNSYQSAIASALTQPDVRQKFAEQGAEACGWAPDRTQRFIAAESERWGGVIKIANVTLE
jgi:tripartite-type tricarboxylate transporter receptor subunit TctC